MLIHFRIGHCFYSNNTQRERFTLSGFLVTREAAFFVCQERKRLVREGFLGCTVIRKESTLGWSTLSHLAYDCL